HITLSHRFRITSCLGPTGSSAGPMSAMRPTVKPDNGYLRNRAVNGPLGNATNNGKGTSVRVALTDDFLGIFPEASISLLVCRNVPAFSAADVERWNDRARACVEASGIASQRLSEEAEFQE